MNESPQGTETIQVIPPGSATHEPNDLSLRPVILFGLVLLGVTVLVLVLMSAFFTSLATRRTQRDAPLSPLAQARPQRPPDPRLQVAPGQELQDMRQAEETILGNYGWIDRAEGIVRIPLEQAMELLVTRGLPTRPGASVAPPGESKP